MCCRLANSDLCVCLYHRQKSTQYGFMVDRHLYTALLFTALKSRMFIAQNSNLFAGAIVKIKIYIWGACPRCTHRTAPSPNAHMGSTVVESPSLRRPIPLAGLTAWAAPAPHFPPYTFRPRASPALSSYNTPLMCKPRLYLIIIIFFFFFFSSSSSSSCDIFGRS